MEAEINRAMIKSLAYKAGTKESDPASLGRVVLEFDADEASAAQIAALIGQGVTVTLSSPQLAMVDRETGQIVGAS